MPIAISAEQYRLPLIKLDEYIYIILANTYQRLYNEKNIDEKYTIALNIDRQMQNTECWRWKMTLVVPTYEGNIHASGDYVGLEYGELDDLHATADKIWPSDFLEYYDITMLEDFSGTYSHKVYLRLDWESPFNNDPGTWQVPIELWGFVVS